MSGSIVLGDVAQRAKVLAVACSRCELTGRYLVADLVARHDASMSIPLLLRILSVNCPKQPADPHDDLCGIHCPDLPALFRVHLRETR
jgi:hypothetical protein